MAGEPIHTVFATAKVTLETYITTHNYYLGNFSGDRHDNILRHCMVLELLTKHTTYC
jgi:hypothetical protein